ncbi:TetR/AcrR family transcriptional regulator [Acidimangrovimonas pyrenivorans]|uniref:TetR/AcrR family transcriptional regulator n=1 Tax=Acidimangrovimonas pyrenivorans TaxID=2030798 RepID=A0ABV7AF31_9RHOB
MSGLRERQKADRRKRIIAAARALFAKYGHENTTIEAIAEHAGVSGVTVHNYYGTKSGVLLALVAESDRELVEKLGPMLAGHSGTLTDLTLRFARIVRDHVLTGLDKGIWRQVIAASITDTESRFGKSYRALDHQLSLALVREVEALQAAGKVPADIVAYDLGKALFHVQNTRFIQYVSSEEITSEEVDALLQRDLKALFSVGAALQAG